MSYDLEVTAPPETTSPLNSPDPYLVSSPVESPAMSSWSIGRMARRIVLLVLILETILVGLLYVPIPPNPDHELYDFMAWSALEDGCLYRNAGDVNMPGEPLLHMVSMSIFGNHSWSYRLLDFLLLIAFSAAVPLLLRRYFGDLLGSLFFGFYLISYTTSGYWMSGQRDLLATHLVFVAGLTYLRRVEGGSRGWLVLSSMILAAAALLKPTFLAAAPLILIAGLPYRRQGLRGLIADIAVMAVVGASALGSVALAGWATDSLRAWFEMTVSYSSVNYTGRMDAKAIVESIISTAARSWQWYMVMALAGLVCWMSEFWKAPLAMLLVTAATVLVSTFTQRKGFGYHFGGLLAPMTLLCSFYLAEVIRLSRRIPALRLRFAVLSFPALMVITGLSMKAGKEYAPQVNWYLGRGGYEQILRSRDFDDVVDAANYARSTTTADQTVWPVSSHLMVNSLAGRRMPKRLANYAFLRFRSAGPLADRWSRDIEAIFREAPPRWIVLETIGSDDPDRFFYMQDIRPDEPAAALKAALDRDYILDRRIGRFAFFRKAGAVAATPGVGL